MSTAATLTSSDIIRITQELWLPMLNLDLTPVDMPVSVKTNGVVSCVQIVGSWEGSVRLEFSPGLARLATAAFLGVTPEQVSVEQVRDCAGELANITAGSLKALVPAPSRISLPTVADGTDFTLEVKDGHTLVQAAFDHKGEKYVVTIIEGDKQ